MSRRGSNRSRRVVVLGPGITEIGGASRRTRLLVQGLVDRGWDVRLITRAGSIGRFRTERRKNLIVLEVPGFRHRLLGAVLFGCLALPLSIIWAIRAQSILAIQLGSQALVGTLAGLLCRSPVLVFSSTGGELSEFEELRSRIGWPIRRRLLSRTFRFVAQTEMARDELAAEFDPDRLVLIPTPYKEVADFGLNGKPRALFTGRFSREKDLFVLLGAWKGVMRRIPDASLTILGAGGIYRSVEPELRARVAADPELSASVAIKGWVDDVSPFLQQSDVYVFPSRSEGMSNALLEAAAHGRVIVASNIPGNSAVLGGDYPLLFPVGDEAALRDQLLRAFSDEPIRETARRDVMRRIAPMSVERVVTRVEELIEDAHSARH